MSARALMEIGHAALLAFLFAWPGGLDCQEISSQRDDALSRELVAELSRLRRDPRGYAHHLEALLPYFEGTLLHRDGRPDLRTVEGASAVREAISALRRAHPMQPLRFSPGLSRAARDHVRDQGPSSGLDHTGRDGSTPAKRMSRYGRWLVSVAENLAFGSSSAREVVMQLVIDDGVPSRGHRKIILDPDYGVAGAACGPHARYGEMCVIDYAVRYQER